MIQMSTIQTIWIWIGYGSRRLDGCQWYWVYGLDKKQQDDMDANDTEDLNQQDNMDANDTEDMDMNWIWNETTLWMPLRHTKWILDIKKIYIN